MDPIKVIEEGYRREITPFRIGDTISVSMKIKEGEKERVQVFTGAVIGRQGSGVRETFTVRKISSGIGVEKVFPVHSPLIENIKVNNDFRNVSNFLSLNNTTIGGVNVSVTAVQNSSSIRGEMVLQGSISGFTVGGQEFWIDEVCPEK